MKQDDNIISIFDFVRDKEKYKNWTSQSIINELKNRGYKHDPNLSEEENDKFKKAREIYILMLQKQIDTANKLGMSIKEMHDYAVAHGLMDKPEEEEEEDD